MLRRERIGKWNAAVSAKQRARKKRYCRIMGCVARNGETGAGSVVVLVWVVLECGVRIGEEDVVGSGDVVAFSMRAQVR